ncbi:MAG: repressor LexA [Candidatus Levybacteria bacterium RIFCSPHIGHO2_02_FULL_40_18]|nr:MAG: repressor LexA [Candidatus Levybacteria bacterium RIFCSPHIGHO2_01_FULL_40_58]OGH27229.1 MAG: repressor LexA [Candidatus Levybacteria bacterium RIFCSPHIGHO2_02_FULL_40_18]OGH31088.1 MAG: repressor LexA [Candidatus Levybacteria bacterium RIFCSPHIGHO2_12_FULL_40_31]OGH40744.1 MAG: repressor LexA [Candidatus Levybacteria bacterium RIFCSPLOWO2_01_FULL_40_64]OGH49382.1 MAG: repressor LexA [Candidatus Levybacteria bacterium RIFCSPLOWO2_02_FULL_41_11]OGH54121.1 MAG: repressor LexA [Candidatus 
MKDLTKKDQNTLRFIIQYQTSNGYSPSMREIKDAIGTKSTRGATLHLDKLNNLGYIKRNPNSRRAIKILLNPFEDKKKKIRVPIVAEVKAGYGGYTEENIQGYKEIPTGLTQGRKDVVLLKIRGESMSKAGFNNGDLAIVIPQNTAYNGDIVVVFDEEERDETIKRFKKLENYAILLPESYDQSYQPRIGTHFTIQGKVIGKLPNQFV